MILDAGDVVAVLALIASVLAALLAYVVSRRQTKLAERHIQLAEAQHALEEELKRYQLEDVRAARTMPSLRVDLRQRSPDRFPELRITNRGGGTAYDISFEAEDAAGDRVLMSDDIRYRLPVKQLDPEGEASFYIAVTSRSRPPLTIRLRWTNPDGTPGERTVQRAW